MKNIILLLLVCSHYCGAQCDISFNTSFYSGFGVSCYGDCNGSITAIPTGVAPFSYNWTNGETTQTISGKCAGVFTLTMTDNTGCMTIDSVEITEPTELVASITILNPISEMGFCDGELASYSTGGTPNYTFDWFNCLDGSGTIWGTPNSACAGEWGVIVTDLNGCTDTACVALNWPNGDTCTFISESYYLGGLDCALGVIQNYSLTIDSYQWINCDSLYAPFPGDISEWYSTYQSGNVAVIISAYGCIDTSECHPACIWGVDELATRKKELIRIIDVIGNGTEDKPNTVLIYLYNDGTVERVFRIE